MGQSNYRMPVAAKKGVEGGTASLLIFLSLADEAKDKGSDLTNREPLPRKQEFQFQQQKGGGSLLSPVGVSCNLVVSVDMHSYFTGIAPNIISSTNTTQNFTIA